VLYEVFPSHYTVQAHESRCLSRVTVPSKSLLQLHGCDRGHCCLLLIERISGSCHPVSLRVCIVGDTAVHQMQSRKMTPKGYVFTQWVSPVGCHSLIKQATRYHLVYGSNAYIGVKRWHGVWGGERSFLALRGTPGNCFPNPSIHG